MPSRSYRNRKKNQDRNHSSSNNAISRHAVNKIMLNAKKRARQRKPFTALQKTLLEEAVKKQMEENKKNIDPEKPLEKPEDLT